MKSLLIKFFLENWPRKLVSLILALFIWLMVSQSMTSSKTVHNVPVKVINIPPGKTIEKLTEKNFLPKKISLTLTGNKKILEDLTSSDVEAVVDAQGKGNEWVPSLSPRDLISYDRNLDLQKAIAKMTHTSFIIKLSNLATEKIPLFVSRPIGEPPEGYQFLDIWPYQLYITLSGPEEVLKNLKAKGLKITFNLNEISSKEIETLKQQAKDRDEVSYMIPDNWKKIIVSSLSSTPFVIDDPKANFLRIDFAKKDLIPLKQPIPIALYFPFNFSETLNPDTYALAVNEFVCEKNGIKVTCPELFVRNTSQQFLDVVKDRLEIVIIVSPKNLREKLLWSVQFIYPKELEDSFVAKIIKENSETTLKNETIKPEQKVEYLRNRFKNYMNNFSLYTEQGQKLDLNIKVDAQEIIVQQN